MNVSLGPGSTDNNITLVGLDFGSTTSNCVVGSARLARGAVGGRVELTDVRLRYRSDLVFTPRLPADASSPADPSASSRLDLEAVDTLLDRWLAEAAVDPGDVFGGGALLTGLAAEHQNADCLPELIRRRLGNVLVASVSDPYLESWSAFLGNVGDLSRSHPDTPILNLDIGGGTTNPALGRAGRVLSSGCYFIGAGHFEFEPGGYRLTRISPYGQPMLDRLNIRRAVGDRLSSTEVDGLVGLMVENLGALIAGEPVDASFRAPGAPQRFAAASHAGDAAITFSGGVGELLYAHRAGVPWPSTTRFGDLGIDLARRIAAAPWADAHRCRFTPTSVGRATAWGLLRHATEVSGSTLYLPRPELLPTADLPIVGQLDADSTDEAWQALLHPASRNETGAALQVKLTDYSAIAIRSFGIRLAGILRAMSYPGDRSLVLLVERNIGKTLGSYAADWGKLSVSLMVIDEIVPREAQFVRIGKPHDQFVPIAFFGLK